MSFQEKKKKKASVLKFKLSEVCHGKNCNILFLLMTLMTEMSYCASQIPAYSTSERSVHAQTEGGMFLICIA